MNSEQEKYIARLLEKRDTFEKKMRTIYAEGSTKHSHAEIGDWIKCFHCMLARQNQTEAKKKLGVGNPKDYMKWIKNNTRIFDDKLRRARNNIYK